MATARPRVGKESSGKSDAKESKSNEKSGSSGEGQRSAQPDGTHDPSDKGRKCSREESPR